MKIKENEVRCFDKGLDADNRDLFWGETRLYRVEEIVKEEDERPELADFIRVISVPF